MIFNKKDLIELKNKKYEHLIFLCMRYNFDYEKVLNITRKNEILKDRFYSWLNKKTYGEIVLPIRDKKYQYEEYSFSCDENDNLLNLTYKKFNYYPLPYGNFKEEKIF